MEQYHGTTILSVRRGKRVALGGDGQVTLGNIVVKASARKVRRIYQERILAGFAGGTADAFTLFERFEAKLEKHQGHLLRSAVELAKDWRTDRMLRRLEAMLAVADRDNSLIITGNGDVLEPEQGIVAIGSGGAYAQAAARALLENSELAPEDIVKKSLTIAGEILGTPYYMCPEQFNGSRIDHRGDIFSLGAVFYQLLTGVVPFPGNSFMEVVYKLNYEPVPALPAELSRF